MKNKCIMATLFGAFLLFSPNVKAANFTDNQTVDTNKTWIVTFTGEVGFDDLTKQGITVTDSTGAAISVGIQLGQNNKTVTVTAPQGGYTAGESYILNVGTKAHSNNGKALKNEYKVHFNIKISDGIVTFKDENLEQVVRDTIHKPTGDIFKSDVKNITLLSGVYKKINDISGIENLTNLQELNLNDNEISDISPLKDLNNLKYLYLNSNKISDINPLTNLTRLESLNLGTNRISDIKPLSNLTNLNRLFLDLCTNRAVASGESNNITPNLFFAAGNFVKDLSPIFNIYPNLTDKDFELQYSESKSWQLAVNREFELLYCLKFNIPFIIKDEKLKAAYEKAQQIINSLITSDMSNIEKEFVLHNYIVENTKYDWVNYSKGTIPEDSCGAYGVLINHIAVCSGYAITTCLLMNMAGVDCAIESGTSNNGVGHAWNIVRIGAKNYST